MNTVSTSGHFAGGAPPPGEGQTSSDPPGNPELRGDATRDDKPWPRELLDAYRRGEAWAFAAIYERYADDVAGLLRWGFSFTSGGLAHAFVGYRGAVDLQDALQETFRRVFEPSARTSYDGLRPFGPYLRTVARNHVIASFRRQSAAFRVIAPTTSEAHVAAIHEVAADQDGCPETLLAGDQIRRLVATFLAGLDEADRQLLHVRFVDGLSQRDAALRLQLGRQQVRTREAKLRGELAAFLGQHGEGQWVQEVLRCLPWMAAALLERAGEVWRC